MNTNAAVIGLAAAACLTAVAHAHPVPKQYYDRTIEVRLAAGRVVVDYRLDVDVLTVYEDLGDFRAEVNLSSLTKPEQFCQAFNKCYAPILADNLVARLDDRPLAFLCVKTGYATRDENGQPLDHLRCELRFEALWPATTSGRHSFTFRESNYELATGHVRLSLKAEPSLHIQQKTEPDEALKNRSDTELRPGDAGELRKVSATFLANVVKPAETRKAVTASTLSPEPAAPTPSSTALAVSAAVLVVALAGLLFLGRQLRRVIRS